MATTGNFCTCTNFYKPSNVPSFFICRRGAAPERHQDAAGGLIRTILITLDDLKITEKTEKGGRRISRIGQQALDLVAGQVARGEV